MLDLMADDSVFDKPSTETATRQNVQAYLTDKANKEKEIRDELDAELQTLKEEYDQKIAQLGEVPKEEASLEKYNQDKLAFLNELKTKQDEKKQEYEENWDARLMEKGVPRIDDTLMDSYHYRMDQLNQTFHEDYYKYLHQKDGEDYVYSKEMQKIQAFLTKFIKDTGEKDPGHAEAVKLNTYLGLYNGLKDKLQRVTDIKLDPGNPAADRDILLTGGDYTNVVSLTKDLNQLAGFD